MTKFASIRQHMKATGIGFAGLEGAWWLPATEPFQLPRQTAVELSQIARAIFCLFDVVTALYGSEAGAVGGLNALLEAKVPTHIPQLISPQPVRSVRPDFQLYRLPNHPGQVQLIATELEICPSAHGFAHAMQVGYGLQPDLVEMFAHFLAGRELIFVGTQRWSEFLFEQLAFCRALAAVGARGRVLYDLPIATIAEHVRRGEQWQPPMFGIQTKPPAWHDDLLARIRQAEFQDYLWPADEKWPATVGDAVVFRFGYFDCFGLSQLERFQQWEMSGATLLNPTSFMLDSKMIMAALQLPTVRQQIAGMDVDALAILDQCIPETILLQPAQVARLAQAKDDWVLKFAGFDSGNQAWGGRSLRVGAQHTQAAWEQVIDQFLALPWPVVAQRATPSARVDIAYVDTAEQQQWMHQGTTRLRTFMLRDATTETNLNQSVWVGGSHVTVSGGTIQVSESTDAVQAPILFL